MIHEQDLKDFGIDYDLWFDVLIIAIGKEFPEKYDHAMSLFPVKMNMCSRPYYKAMSDMIESFATSYAIEDFQEAFAKKTRLI